jgi:hypothetical protein
VIQKLPEAVQLLQTTAPCGAWALRGSTLPEFDQIEFGCHVPENAGNLLRERAPLIHSQKKLVKVYD